MGGPGSRLQFLRADLLVFVGMREFPAPAPCETRAERDRRADRDAAVVLRLLGAKG